MNHTQTPAPTLNRYPWGDTQGRYPCLTGETPEATKARMIREAPGMLNVNKPPSHGDLMNASVFGCSDHSTEFDDLPMTAADARLSLSLLLASMWIVAGCVFLVLAQEPLAALWEDAVDVFRLWWSGVRPWVMP